MTQGWKPLAMSNQLTTVSNDIRAPNSNSFVCTEGTNDTDEHRINRISASIYCTMSGLLLLFYYYLSIVVPNRRTPERACSLPRLKMILFCYIFF